MATHSMHRHLHLYHRRRYTRLAHDLGGRLHRNMTRARYLGLTQICFCDPKMLRCCGISCIPTWQAKCPISLPSRQPTAGISGALTPVTLTMSTRNSSQSCTSTLHRRELGRTVRASESQSPRYQWRQPRTLVAMRCRSTRCRPGTTAYKHGASCATPAPQYRRRETAAGALCHLGSSRCRSRRSSAGRLCVAPHTRRSPPRRCQTHQSSHKIQDRKHLGTVLTTTGSLLRTRTCTHIYLACLWRCW